MQTCGLSDDGMTRGIVRAGIENIRTCDDCQSYMHKSEHPIRVDTHFN